MSEELYNIFDTDEEDVETIIKAIDRMRRIGGNAWAMLLDAICEKMDGDRSDYHVYNTMRLFTEADMTTYDGIEQLVSGLGTPYTDAFFGGRG